MIAQGASVARLETQIIGRRPVAHQRVAFAVRPPAHHDPVGGAALQVGAPLQGQRGLRLRAGLARTAPGGIARDARVAGGAPELGMGRDGWARVNRCRAGDSRHALPGRPRPSQPSFEVRGRELERHRTSQERQAVLEAAERLFEARVARRLKCPGPLEIEIRRRRTRWTRPGDRAGEVPGGLEKSAQARQRPPARGETLGIAGPALQIGIEGRDRLGRPPRIELQLSETKIDDDKPGIEPPGPLVVGPGRRPAAQQAIQLPAAQIKQGVGRVRLDPSGQIDDLRLDRLVRHHGRDGGQQAEERQQSGGRGAGKESPNGHFWQA